MNDKISVIIPIYNAEKTLRKCIDSVLAQTHKNIEIILIDDGSTDDSLNICNEYINKDSRVKLFKQENQGVSSARNLGLEHANGDYISFVDSDDYIENNMYDLMLNSIRKSKSDIAICNIFFEDMNNKAFYSKEHSEFEFYKDEYPQNAYYIKSISGFACNKLYSKKMIYHNDNIYVKFNTNIKIIEDDLFNYEIFDENQNIKYSYIDNKLYHYIFNKGSLTNKKFNYNKLSFFDVKEKEISILESNGINSDFLKADYIIHFIRTRIIINKLKVSPNEKYEEIENKSKVYIKQIEYKNLLFITKLKLIIATKIPLIYRIKLINKYN